MALLCGKVDADTIRLVDICTPRLSPHSRPGCHHADAWQLQSPPWGRCACTHCPHHGRSLMGRCLHHPHQLTTNCFLPPTRPSQWPSSGALEDWMVGATIVKLVLPIPSTTPSHRYLHTHAPTHTHVNLVATQPADRR